MEKDYHFLEQGKVLKKRYLIQDVLGEGGFGITYRAIDNIFGITVAVKEFFPHGLVVRNVTFNDDVTVTNSDQKEMFARGREKFLDEAKIMARFNDQEGIVNFTDFFEENCTVYIVMEYLEGVTMRQYLNQNGVMPVEDVLTLMVPVVEALDEVHRQGLIHRDISPDNIMILYDGRVKLMDFGAARAYSEFGEKSLSVVLKPGYAPEEQYRTRGVQGPWTDIYGLSATIYKCITSVTPEDSIQRLVEDHTQKPSDLGCPIDPRTEAALMKGLSVFARDRYQDLKSFSEDLYVTVAEADLAGASTPGAGQQLQPGGQEGQGQLQPGRPVGQGQARPVIADRQVGDAKWTNQPEASDPYPDSSGNPTGRMDQQFFKDQQSQKNHGRFVYSEDRNHLPEGSPAGRPAGREETAFASKKGSGQKPARTSGGKVLALIISLLVLIVAAGSCMVLLSSNRPGSSQVETGEVTVPDFTGMEYEAAVDLAKNKGLVLNNYFDGYSDTVPEGHIIFQNVDAGETVKRNSTVIVSVSKGPRP